MKPHGTIPPWFDAARMTTLLARIGDTPAFAYDFPIVRDKIGQLRAALPDGVGVHYAVKANPLPALAAAIVPLVDGLDVASAGELTTAQNAGARNISFAGPGKRDAEISAAVRAGVTINIESAGELKRALRIGDALGTTPHLAVRVNPDFALKGSGMKMGGGPAPFGIDCERVPEIVRSINRSGAKWCGFHIFSGSQSLDSGAIAASQAQTLKLAGALAEAVSAPPPLVNLGGGLGIPYFSGDIAVDIDLIGNRLGDALQARSQMLQGTTFAVELGRWLVGECGIYLTRVVDRKDSRGETYLVTDGGLHHQLAASGNFGTVVRRNYPIAVASSFDADAVEVVNVVGCLCTPLDRLGDQVFLPRAEPGDVIAIFMAGAYGASASPAAFLGHGPAQEVFVDG